MGQEYGSSTRLRRLQALLKKCGTDGLLCVLGIDSWYSKGSTELANYLLLGFYDRHPSMSRPRGISEETLQDVIILVEVDGVHIYCNPINYKPLLPAIVSWRNLRVHCMNEDEYKDQEAAEEFKIKSFVEMVHSCQTVGVPSSTNGPSQVCDSLVVERWPIVQAFALETIGAGRGFFTMNHTVVDVSDNLQMVYNQMDPVSLKVFITQNLTFFQHQWSNVFSLLDVESSSTTPDASPLDVGEPFRTYFHHGCPEGHVPEKCMQPYVLFGVHTSKRCIEENKERGGSLKTPGHGGSHARHMVLQCVCPKSSLICTRTYFLGSSTFPHLGRYSPLIYHMMNVGVFFMTFMIVSTE
uniref:dynein axonemal assembly factor 9-like n=1 Tax=Myxine glutinosa TaxID=7769 RepID=UPI00358E83EA